MSKRHGIVFAFIALFTLANIQVVFNRGLYGDGSAFLRFMKAGSMERFWPMFLHSRQLLHYCYFLWSQSFGDAILAGKTIAFLGWLVFSWMVFLAISKHFRVPRAIVFWSSAAIVTHPTYLCLNEFGAYPYSIDLTLFSVAVFLHWIAVSRYRSTRPIYFGLVIASIVAFWLSFAMASLLSLYALFLLHAFLVEKQSVAFLTVKDWMKRNVPLLILPLVYFALKPKPYEDYAEYNQIRPEYLIRLPARLREVFREYYLHSFKFPTLTGITKLQFWGVFAGLLVVFGAGTWFFSRFWPDETKRDVHDARYMIRTVSSAAGLCLASYILGIAPYLAVNKIPYFLGCTTRQGMLLPVSQVFLLLTLFLIAYWIFRLRATVLFGALLGCYLVTGTALNYYKWDIDACHEASIVANFKDHPELKNVKNLYVINRNEPALNYPGNPYNDYYNTALYFALGINTMDATGSNDVDIKEWPPKLGPNDRIYELGPGSYALRLRDYPRIKFLEWTDENRFLAEIKDLDTVRDCTHDPSCNQR